MPVALVIEPDPRERALLASHVRRVRGVSAITAGSLEEAGTVMDIDPPDILITRWALPDGDGVQAIARARRLHREPTCVVFVLDEDAAPPAAMPSDPGVHVLHRPISARQIRKLLERTTRETLDRQPLLSPAEYLQLACMGGHSAVVQCSRDGLQLGEIFVHEGEIWAANDEHGDGVAAFRRLVRGGSLARLRRPEEAPPSRNVQGHWEYLLLEAARREDEETTGRHSLHPAPLDDSEVSRQVDQLLSAAARAVLRRDLRAAAESFQAAAALRPNDKVIKHNLERLRGLGYTSQGES